MSLIELFYEDVRIILNNPKQTKNWIKHIVEAEGKQITHINYIFCSDEYLHTLNVKHLGHEFYTDIITFDLSDDATAVEADIFISIDRVEENSFSLKNNFNHELHRVMIHGVLHLLGYGDKSAEDKKVMREKEESCLSLYRF